jgi:solute carrier family 25 folate transporter 32
VIAMRGPPLALFQLIHVPPSLHSMVAGAGAGLVSSIATCPLDVVKTTLQAQSVARGDKGYEGVTKTIMRIYRQSGLRGFYRGLGPTIGGYLPTWGIYFTVYDFIKDRLRRVPLAVAHPDMSHVVAAMTAGATGTILTNPLWVVKTRFMAQAILPPTAKRYRNTVQAFYTIYKNEGLRAFYKGLLPSLFGVSHVAVQFGLYEKSKSWASREGRQLTPTAILACSAFSKMVASLATYPHEVLRTRIQVQRNRPAGPPQPTRPPEPVGSGPVGAPAGSSSRVSHATLYSPLVTGSEPPYPEKMEQPMSGNGRLRRWHPKRGGIIDVCRLIYRQDGWRGFYRGLSINLVRTVPSSAVTMLSYELIMRNLALSSSSSS